MARRRTWWSNAALRSALIEGGGDIITSIFADGTDGFYFDFSKTDQLFQDLLGTPADGAGENIYSALESHAWSGRSLAQYRASAPELVTNGDFSDGTTGWSATIATLAISSGEFEVTNTASSVGIGESPAFATIVGRTYIVEYTIRRGTSSSASLQARASGGAGSTSVTTTSTTDVSGQFTFVATSTSSVLWLSANQAVSGRTVYAKRVSVKEIPGNHGLQATTSAQPKWQTGGLARFDGSDDYLLTTLVPATAFSLMFKAKLTALLAAGVAMTGSRVTGTDSRFYFGFDADEQLFANVGNNVVTRVGSLYNTVGVAGLVLSGGNATLYWNSVAETPGAVGTPNTTIALPLGAINTSGVISGFFPGDIYYGLGIKKALTAAQIAAITNKWGTS